MQGKKRRVLTSQLTQMRPGPSESSTIMPTAAAYDFSTLISAQNQISLALDGYESACNALDLQQSTLSIFVNQAFSSSVECERDILAQQTSRLMRISAKLSEIRNRSLTVVPISRLLPELLSTIFIMTADCVRASYSTVPDHTHKSLKFINGLSSVCSRWRHVALNTPALWAHIDLNRKGGPNYAALWLDRARSYPLHVSYRYPAYEGTYREWTSLLEPHSHRFRMLSLKMDVMGQTILRNACVRHLTAPLSLEYLALVAYSGEEIPVWEMYLVQSEIHALLETHSIHLYRVPLSALPSPAYQGLRYLCLDSLSEELALPLEPVLEILRVNPDLRYFELSNTPFNIPLESDVSPIKLERLEILRIGYIQERVTQWLLKHLVLGHEGTTLVLSQHSSDESRIGVGLRVLSNHSITTLCFLSPGFGPKFLDIDALLTELPSLQMLALEDASVYVHNHPDSAEKHHPVLSNLSLVSCYVDYPEAFMDMVVRHSVRRMRIFDVEKSLNKTFVLKKAPDVEFSEEPGSSAPLTWQPFD